MRILIRYGEIGLKGGNRPYFEKQLVRRIRRTLGGLAQRVWREHGRVFVDTDADWAQVAARLRHVFGIVSFSRVAKAPHDYDAIVQAARAVVEQALPAHGAEQAPLRFKVEARRAYKQVPWRSTDLNRQLGADLLAAFPGLLAVDVHEPELRLQVEIREDYAYLYGYAHPGPGGLPVGSSGRALALLSGGIDSPVAVWMTMKRGVATDAVHFHSPPFTSERAREKVLDLADILSRYGGPLRVHSVHFTEIQTAIGRHCPVDLAVTIMRRMMMRIANQLAERHGALALVTGENVGQVASQTLENIRAINEVAAYPVLRPLTGFDKQEIIDLAKRIGTYETSILPYIDCCSLFVPRHPATRPSLDEVRRAEAALPVDDLVAAALERIETTVHDAWRRDEART